MANPNEIRELLVMLTTTYPAWEREMGDERLRSVFALYERLLADIPIEVLQAAALVHITESRFFPTIAELRNQAVEIIAPEHLTALEAWHDQADPIAQQVRYMLPDYNDRRITLREQAISRSIFMKTYDQIVAREKRELQRLPDVRDLRKRLREQRAAALVDNNRAVE